MNNITLAHIGGELVVIGGIAFYFHRKTGQLQEQVLSLSKANKELSDAVEDLAEQVTHLTGIVMQMQGRRLPNQGNIQNGNQITNPIGNNANNGNAPTSATQREHFRQVPQGTHQGNGNIEIPKTIGVQGSSSSVSFPGNKKKVRKIRKVSKKSDSDDSGDETLDDRDLDQELVGEYKQLAKERKKEVCEGEQCKLVD